MTDSYSPSHLDPPILRSEQRAGTPVQIPAPSIHSGLPGPTFPRTRDARQRLDCSTVTQPQEEQVGAVKVVLGLEPLDRLGVVVDAVEVLIASATRSEIQSENWLTVWQVSRQG